MTALVVLLAAGIATYFLRASTVLVLNGRSLPPRVRSALGAAVPAGLAAMIAISVVARGGEGTPARVLALAVAAATARFTRHALAVVGVGMATLWILAAVGV